MKRCYNDKEVMHEICKMERQCRIGEELDDMDDEFFQSLKQELAKLDYDWMFLLEPNEIEDEEFAVIFKGDSCTMVRMCTRGSEVRFC